jgi:hypothetical protein
MPLSIQIQASLIAVAGRWAFERARMLKEESSRQPATKSFEDLLKEHFNDYYHFLEEEFSREKKARTHK